MARLALVHFLSVAHTVSLRNYFRGGCSAPVLSGLANGKGVGVNKSSGLLNSVSSEKVEMG